MNNSIEIIFLLTLAIIYHLFYNKLVACQGDSDDRTLIPLNDSGLDTILHPDLYPSEEIHEHAKCQPMRIPFCENVGYNMTLLPNHLGHKTQQEVIKEINAYHPLTKVGCSDELKLYLCTVYAPMCFDQVNGSKPVSLLPCRSLCESALKDCLTHLRQSFRHNWPQTLQCDKLPVRNIGGVDCVGKDDDTKQYSTDSKSDSSGSEASSSTITRNLSFICPKNFELNSYTLHLNGKTYSNCALPCEDVLLDKTSAQIVKFTVGILAIVCLASTIFTCLTFIVDTKRFKYPARPIIIIAFCQLIVAACYLLGFLTNSKIACNDPTEPPKSLPNMRMIRTVTMGNKKGSCTLQFMVLYFFQMSTLLWWLMMTISWYMIATLEWAPEAVSGVSRYFHVFSWTAPALLTIYLSVLGDIEGDPLTGTCYASMSNQETIKAFVMYPLLICVVAGCIFLLIGFKSLWERRETLKREYGKQRYAHDKLVMRIGFFSMFFTIFSGILFYCHYYEQSNLNTWMLSWLTNICKNREYSIPCPLKDFSGHGPHYSAFILKHVATMAVGIISALFMLSERTWTMYQEEVGLCNYRL